MDRRAFFSTVLKTTFIFTGAIFIPKLGTIKPAHPFWFAQTKKQAGGASFATWTGVEAGWGNENAFILLGEGGSSSDEIGQGGGLSEANRTWSQSGGIAGSGTYRTLDGVDDFFNVTPPFRDFLSNATQYGIMFKLEDWSPDTDYESIIRWAASDVILRVATAPTYTLQGYVGGVSVGGTADGITTAGVVFCYLGCNGANTMVGFTSSGSGAGGQPTKLSDFSETKRVLAGSSLTMPAMTEAAPNIFRDSDGDIRYVGAKFHWAVFCNNDPLIQF